MLHMDVFITVYIFIITAAFGAVFGSFINCMAWRIVHKENVLKGRSHCTSCGHELRMTDMIPVFSYILLKGRCKYCKAKVSVRYMLTEIFLALVFVSFVIKYDISPLTLRYLVLACILLGLSLVDLDSYEIPNGFIVAGIFWWSVTLPFLERPITRQLVTGLIGGIAIGGGILIFSLLMDKVLKNESMGGGDIKLFFMLGLYMGPILSLLNLIISCFFGLILVVLLRKSKIPFGPAIAGASWVTLLIGTDIVNWYLGLFV